MLDPVIECFKQEYDRFQGFLEQQIEVCPSEEVWLEKLSNIAYWQHLMHCLACTEFYARPFGAPLKQTLYPREVVRFQAEPSRAMTRDEMRALAADMKNIAHAYFETLTAASLPQKNETMSQHMGKDMTHQQAMMALIRHPAYHIGCLDSVLRAHGVPGVY